MMVMLGIVLIFIQLLFQPSSQLLSSSRMEDLAYRRCHGCSVTRNQIHSHRLFNSYFIIHRSHTLPTLRLLLQILVIVLAPPLTLGYESDRGVCKVEQKSIQQMINQVI